MLHHHWIPEKVLNGDVENKSVDQHETMKQVFLVSFEGYHERRRMAMRNINPPKSYSSIRGTAENMPRLPITHRQQEGHTEPRIVTSGDRDDTNRKYKADAVQNTYKRFHERDTSDDVTKQQQPGLLANV
jgi:hypothetical protein